MENNAQNKKNIVWNIIIALFVIIIGNGVFNYLKPLISSLSIKSSLSQYKIKITECVESGDKKIIGLEYECAIRIASTFYATDPEKAIQLCISYNPFITTQLENKRSDAAISTDNSLASATCKSAIEKLLTKNSPESAEKVPKEDAKKVDDVKMEPITTLGVSALCTNAPIETESGNKTYPIDPKYNSLTFLGQLFTAYNCNYERVDEIFGVNGDNYTLGSAVWLKNNPSQSLINIFKSIGFTCTQEASEVNCKKWEIWDTIKVEQLMKLEPYHENFEADDCRNCG